MLAPQGIEDNNRYLFSTKEFDSRSGLYFFGARYYDSEIGRWLTPDPLGMVDGPNLYIYLNNNPINLIDPLGYCMERQSWLPWLLGGFTLGQDTGRLMLRMFEQVGGEAYRLQWRIGGQLYHFGDSAKYGFHFATETVHYYWNRWVVQANGQWVEIPYPLIGKIVGATTSVGLVGFSAWAGWEAGTAISKLPVPNLVGASDWGVTFGESFIPPQQ